MVKSDGADNVHFVGIALNAIDAVAATFDVCTLWPAET